MQNCNTKLDALIQARNSANSEGTHCEGMHSHAPTCQEEIDDLFGKVDVDGSQALDMSEAKSMVSRGLRR